MQSIWRTRRPNRAGAAQAHARPSVKKDTTPSVSDRQAPRDRDNFVANWDALLASHLGPTADSAFEKANAKAIRDLNRKIAALQPIPPAEDTDGNVLLDSEDEEIEGEDPDATKRAVLTARLVPLTAEAARIGKEKKKAYTALHAHLGVKVIATLTRFNSL